MSSTMYEIINSAHKRLCLSLSRAYSSLFCDLVVLQVQNDLTLHMAEPRPALGQRGRKEAPRRLRLRPGHSLRQNQGLHPDATHALQPGGAAGRHGAEDRPLPAEGKAASLWWSLRIIITIIITISEEYSKI